MQLTADPWQSCAENWQPSFIHHNFLLIGYVAWRGYLASGPGLVVGETVRTPADVTRRPVSAVRLTMEFVPAAAVGQYLAQRGLAADVIAPICSVAQAYPPTREILLGLNDGDDITIQQLQNLAIAPPVCYRQVCDRWSEFTDAAGTLAPDCRHLPTR